LKFKVK